MIRFTCPGCNATFSVEDSRAGQSGRCPKCQTQFIVPSPEPTAAPPPVVTRSEAAPEPAVVPSPPPVTVPAPPPELDPAAAVEIEPCPKCRARLSITAAQLGADVECPYCKTVYKATQGTPVDRPPRRDDDRRDRRRDEEDDDRPARRARRDDDDDDRPSRRRRDEDDDYDRPRRRRRDDDDYDDDYDRPARRRARRDDDDDDYDDRPRRRARRDDDFDDDYDRPRRRGRRDDDYDDEREEAASAVAVPAILLMIIGGLGLVFGAFAILSAIMGWGRPAGAPENFARTAGEYIGAFVAVIWGAIVLAGALKMKSLSGRGGAMIGAITAMLPCNALFLLGLPIGIWALVVLRREDIKAAFESSRRDD